MHRFNAVLEIIGVNPFLTVPEEILSALFKSAGRDKGPIPIRGEINGLPYTQTLVKYAGQWRLYVNMIMLKDSPRRIGERVSITLEPDPQERRAAVHPKLAEALASDPVAAAVFESLPPSRRHEIVRYIAGLKSEASVDKNVLRAIGFLKGQGRFVGRDKP